MASTASILKSADIASAKQAVETYRTTCADLYTRLQTEINTLTAPGAGFNGDAAFGYTVFFMNITPALTDNLTGEESSLCTGLINALNYIETSILNTVDPQLGELNQKALDAATTAP